MDLSDPRYGNVQVAVSIDEKAVWRNSRLLIPDDKHIEGAIRKYVRDLVFELPS